MTKGKIYLFPSALSDREPSFYLPADYVDLVLSVKYYAVENIRTARRFLRKIQPVSDINGSTFFVLDKHSLREDAFKVLKTVQAGNDLIVLSEAGAPGIADPGALLVQLAHDQNIRVVPLVGASSIIMAMMASGMNGQNFAFSGYLPIKRDERIRQIKSLCKRVINENQAQIFMETPYRNNHLLADILQFGDNKLKLCLAANVTAKDEFIQTKNIKLWQKNPPDLHKIPCIFILGKDVL